MLKELYIENLAVIARAAIPFDTKLNVFTGETGAGKSILIHGINAVAATGQSSLLCLRICRMLPVRCWMTWGSPMKRMELP